ncbi:hypothetical protein D3C71_1307660 [compost metagenome]
MVRWRLENRIQINPRDPQLNKIIEILCNPFQIAAEKAVRLRNISPLPIHIRLAIRISIGKSLGKNLIPHSALCPCRSVKHINRIQVWKTEKAIAVQRRSKALFAVNSDFFPIMQLKHVDEPVILRRNCDKPVIEQLIRGKFTHWNGIGHHSVLGPTIRIAMD